MTEAAPAAEAAPPALAWAGVTGQLQALRDGRTTSAALVELALARIGRYDGRLGAMHALRAAEARAEVADADARRADGGAAPLLGLPLLVKESHAVAGMVGALGTPSVERAATADSDIVAALRAAGAIVVGTTTMPELALWPFGPAANPWDTSRTSGGSSSGSAAAVAAGLVAVATASDGGGSIRLPAAMCGLVGLKVAPGQLPGGGGWHGLSVDGVLTRSVADTAVVLDALRGSTALADAAATPPGPLRIAWWGKAPLPPHAGDDMAATLGATVGRLAGLGHATAQVDPGWSAAGLSFMPRYTAGAAADRRGLADPRAVEARTALVAGLGARVPARVVAGAVRRGVALRAGMQRRLAGHDVLVLPSVPGPAPAAAPLRSAGRAATVLGASRLAAYTSPVNAAGFASLSLPAGWSRDGLPLGVQLVSPTDDLELLVSLAAQLEADIAWDTGHPSGFDEAVDEAADEAADAMTTPEEDDAHVTVQSAPPIAADLEGALGRRLRRSPGDLLKDRSATVQLDAGAEGAWSVELRRGRPITWHRRVAKHPTTTVRASVPTLTALVDGRLSGVRAFLDGDVTVRGDVGLALALDGVFRHEERHETWARTRLINPVVGGKVLPTATIGAGEYDAPPVILLHGLGATAASLLPLQWDLARDHRVHAPDMPGFGDSAKPRGSYDPAFFVRWLAAYLDVLGVDECVLVGNSLGGRVALEAGLAIPERVRALVLLCPSPAFRRVRQMVPLVKLIPSDLGRFPSRLPHSAVVEGVRAMMSVPERLPQTWYDAGADEFQRVWRHASARRAFFAAARQIYLEEAYGERGFWDRLPSLDVPALFVWGDRDRLVPSSFARHVAAALPDSAAIVMEDCGHVPQIELPDETAAVVRGFLAEHP